ncbi:MAG: class I SAM-dependent methyltransferase [bacterium]|nr:class I SAM-dependent methyltransferase [bacterium]
MDIEKNCLCNFQWDISPKINNGRISQEWKKFILEMITEEPCNHFYLRTAYQILDLIDEPLVGKKILDAGCTPVVSLLFAFLGAEVTMLDISKGEMKRAYDLARSLGIQNRINFITADIFHLPFNKVFDITLNNGVIEHFDNLVDVIQCMKTSVHTNGKICLLVPNKWTFHTFLFRPLARHRRNYYWDYMGREKSYTPYQLGCLMNRAGLRVKKTNTANLRRNFIDDYLILKFNLNKSKNKKLLFNLINKMDMLENNSSFPKYFGFMTGAIGILQ